MAEKVTVMVLTVDLQCSCCYKKIKKLLCQFPQIRDQTYDDKKNQVTITVVCSSPEKIRDKLCCKGGKVIKSIDIKKPEPPKPKPEPPKPKPEPPKPAPHPCGPCQEIHVEVQCGCPPYPGRGCCGPCSKGPTLPPPPPPQLSCEGYCYGYGGWYEYGGWHGYGGRGKECRVRRCDYYFSEENPQGCTIM